MKTLRLAFWLAALCAMTLEDAPTASKDAPGTTIYALPDSSTVPCSTDQDCADKNPGVTGLYAFPEKGTK